MRDEILVHLFDTLPTPFANKVHVTSFASFLELTIMTLNLSWLYYIDQLKFSFIFFEF